MAIISIISGATGYPLYKGECGPLFPRFNGIPHHIYAGDGVRCSCKTENVNLATTIFSNKFKFWGITIL